MRVDIRSTDRVGITQEILAIFAKENWNIQAMEVAPGHTYVSFGDIDLAINLVKSSLASIEGIDSCHAIDLLPGERRSQYLDALLSKIPDAIIDIDADGIILVANSQALNLMNQKELIENQCISDFVDLPVDAFLNHLPCCQEIVFNGKAYFADITPVGAQGVVSGSVIVLQSPDRLGQQMSAVGQRAGETGTELIARSANMIKVLEQAKRFAQLGLPVLISGETGTGKELLARAIHGQSERANKPFLAINCAALPEHLLESELFGYVAGAFSGAQRSGKPGLFEMAAGGSVFLDEIGEMSTYLQAKLLRFLEDFSLRRLGSTKEQKVDVRIISATHRELAKMVEQKQFRDDLYYRLNVLSLELPPLRARLDDINLLANHFISMAAKQVGLPAPELESKALEKLKSHRWLGNIRQLQNTLFRTVALTSSQVIKASDLAFDELIEHQSNEQLKAKGIEDVVDWHNAICEFEQTMLKQLYPLYPTTRKLAERLNVSHNKIAMKLKQYGINKAH